VKILLSGATGFVGNEVLKQAVEAGHQVRILARRPERADVLVKQYGVEVFHGNILAAPSLAGSMEGIDAVVHLVGIITEFNELTFDRVHREGTIHLLTEARKAKLKRWIQMSALGARPNARARYHQSKWAAEEAVRAAPLEWTIIRPSVIYGRRDGFVNLFARMMRFPWNAFQLFTVPAIGGGFTHLQPLPVEDVARVIVRALDKPESFKKTYDLCGPEPLRLRQILSEIAAALGKRASVLGFPGLGRRWFGDGANLLLPVSVLLSMLRSKPLVVPVPWDFARALAWLMETFTERPLLNRDQILMLEEDNVGNPADAIKDFGINPPAFREGIARCLSA
jgi:NADH dehydrogenase